MSHHFMAKRQRLWGVGLVPGRDAWDLLSLLDGVYVGVVSQADWATILQQQS